MTPAEALAIWKPLLGDREGYLDAAVRIQEQRGLTPEEQAAIDVLYGEFTEAMQKFATWWNEARQKPDAS